MRRTLMFTAAALTLGVGAGSTAALAQATTVGPSVEAAAPPPPSANPGPPGWHHHFGPGSRPFGGHRLGWRGRMMPFAPGAFGLFTHRPDKHLSPADVQEIAQAILLWNGNHDWKVTQVAAGQNQQVTFAYAAPDGTVIAKFAINQDSGRISRID